MYFWGPESVDVNSISRSGLSCRRKTSARKSLCFRLERPKSHALMIFGGKEGRFFTFLLQLVPYVYQGSKVHCVILHTLIKVHGLNLQRGEERCRRCVLNVLRQRVSTFLTRATPKYSNASDLKLAGADPRSWSLGFSLNTRSICRSHSAARSA